MISNIIYLKQKVIFFQKYHKKVKIKQDLKKSLFKFQISFDNSESKSYKRFCYTYIYKVRKKLNEKGIINPKNKDMKLKRYIKLYSKMAAMCIKTKMTYRADFIISSIGVLVTSVLEVLTIFILLQSIDTFKGWSYYEMVFIH